MNWKPVLGGLSLAVAITAVFALFQELTTRTPPLPDAWLTEVEQEQLADITLNFRPDQRVAACLWEGRDRADILAVLDLPRTASLWGTETRGGRPVSLAIVEHAPPTGSLVEREGHGYFCWIAE